MYNGAYLENIYIHADVYPVNKPERRAKFLTGSVKNKGTNEVSFLKAVREGSPDSVSQDLATEANWNSQVQPFLSDNGIRVPRVQKHSSQFKWVLFEHIEGKPIQEKDLEKYVERIAKLCAQISGVPLGREPNGLSLWMKNRLQRFTSPRSEDQLNSKTKNLILSIADSVENADLQAGTVHGDINLKNLLVGEQLGDTIGLVDAEFGTLISKPEWDKPRFHDAAYFYHLLYCQYLRPDLAEKFKTAFEHEMQLKPDFNPDTFETEFNLSVLERTLSMGSHFPWRTDQNKPIEDIRRLNPEPYVSLIDSSLHTITL